MIKPLLLKKYENHPSIPNTVRETFDIPTATTETIHKIKRS